MQANDPAANTNQRMPTLTLPGEYPYVMMFQSRSGSWWRLDDTPGYEGLSMGHVTGTFHEMTVDGHSKVFSSNNSYHYTSAGSTTTVDQNTHNKVGGSAAHQISGDQYTEHGNNHIFASGGDQVNLTNGTQYHHATGGITMSSAGNFVTNHDDNHHHNIQGDNIVVIGGTDYATIGAEFGRYVPAGNMDFTVSGNIQLNSSQAVTIKGSQSITLICGSTKIVMGPSSLEFHSPSINFFNS